MELPIKFVYTENGVEKSSIDENRRMNYIDKFTKMNWNDSSINNLDKRQTNKI